MNATNSIITFTLTATLACPAACLAQVLPTDCSTARIPSQPVSVSVEGASFTPKLVKFSRGNTMKMGDDEYQMYDLEIKNVDDFSPPLELDVTVMVRKGQNVDGRVFRALPTKDTSKQPGPGEGAPEVQGWVMKNKPANVRISHVDRIASLRLEFAQRKGNSIAGSIYLCVPKGQKGIFDKTPSKDDSSAIGMFEAVIK